MKIVGTSSANILRGTTGDDVVLGAEGDDTLYGYPADPGSPDGNDRLEGGPGNDVLRGGQGNDWFDAGDGAQDRVYGGGGHDRLHADYGALVDGVVVTNTAAGGRIASIRDGTSNTLLFSEIEERDLKGGDGDDTLRGGAWNDLLYGGAGNDRLSGGLGADVFLYRLGDGRDYFADFSAAQGDKVNLTGVAVATLAGGKATLSDGTVLTAAGYSWMASDFI